MKRTLILTIGMLILLSGCTNNQIESDNSISAIELDLNEEYAEELPSIVPVSPDRFIDHGSLQVVKDEASVHSELAPKELQQLLDGLSFEAVVQSRLETVASYQVYLPGTELFEDVEKKVEVIDDLPGIEATLSIANRMMLN